MLKFGLSERGTKLDKHLPLKFDVLNSVKFKWKIFLNFMPFSESPNFTLCKRTTRSRPGQTKPILIVTRKHIVVNYVEMS